MGQLCPIGTWQVWEAQWVSYSTDVQHTSQKAQQALFFKYGGKALRAHHEWFQVIVPLLIHRCFAAFCKYTLGLVLVVRRRRISYCFVSFCLFLMVLSCIRPQRWSIFQGDGMVNVFFLGHHRRQWFFNGFYKVGPSPFTIECFLGVQPLEPMVFRWFSKF